MFCYLLANAGISGQNISILSNGEGRRTAVRDLKHTTPLGKITTISFVLGTAFG